MPRESERCDMFLYWIYVIAAIGPAIYLLCYIYKKDTIEKEPGKLLVSLFFMGCLAGVISVILEEIGDSVLSSYLDPDSPAGLITSAFFVVAVVEEGTKFILLKARSWKDINFNYRFDGVVYAVFVSLGFAALENIGYVFSFGLSVSLTRALLAIPGHMGFAVFMGAFYGRAKVCEVHGDNFGKNMNLIIGYLTAVFLHGFYDATAMLQTTASTLLYIAFVIVMYIIVYRKIKRESATDAII